MPNSLKSRLKKLEHQGLLSEKDLNRIVVIPDNATNGDIIKTLFDVKEVRKYRTRVTVWTLLNGNIEPIDFQLKWWNTPYKLSELKGEQE